MRKLILLAIIVSSGNVFASKLVNIQNFTNPALKEVKQSIAGLDSINYSAGKKVLDLKAVGKTAQEKRHKTVAQAIHTLCPYFDDGVALGLTSKDEVGLNDVVATFETYMVSEEVKSLKEIVKTASNSSDLEIYNGEASGNNTVGAVIGIYDVKNQEILVFSSTNCGSDD
jgi:hypothetical protein